MNPIAVKNLLAIIAFVIVVFVALASSEEADSREAKPVPLIICDVFGRYCDQALRVSWCESHWRTTARNGQYLGTFQMGSWERRTFGHGPDAYSQARAAWRYFTRSGRDWSPWECRWAA